MRVVSHDYPYLEVRWRVEGHGSSASAYVDTGFDGGLVVPVGELANLPEPVDVTIIQLGDGAMTWVPEYLGAVVLVIGSFR